MEPEAEQKFHKQAEMLANRVKKRFRACRKRFARRNIEVFRLYDWDIPEIRAVVDWYAGHLVIGEYMRKQSVPGWLPLMGEAVARILEVPADQVHLKERRAGKQQGHRYERIDYSDQKIVVSERDLRFFVNPRDYVDTGLFSDHRETRQRVREMAEGKDFLNLYCYTGTFSCYAAKGGARSTLSVDRSKTAIQWAGENFRINKIPRDGHTLVQAETFGFLERLSQRNDLRFDLAVVDPPSYSTAKEANERFDVLHDHPKLLEAVLRLMRKRATLIFSTNHQNFEPKFKGLEFSEAREITHLTIPEDYARKRTPIHRCWEITV